VGEKRFSKRKKKRSEAVSQVEKGNRPVKKGGKVTPFGLPREGKKGAGAIHKRWEKAASTTCWRGEVALSPLFGEEEERLKSLQGTNNGWKKEGADNCSENPEKNRLKLLCSKGGKGGKKGGR